MKEIEIYGDYIQLDQFLKKENMISSGGEKKAHCDSMIMESIRLIDEQIGRAHV